MLRYYIRYSSDVSHYVQNGLSEYAALQEVQLAICIAVLGAILAALSCLLRISQKNIAILMRCTKHIVASDYEYVRQQNFSSESDWGRLGIAIQHMSDRIDHYLEEIQEKNRLSHGNSIAGKPNGYECTTVLVKHSSRRCITR